MSTDSRSKNSPLYSQKLRQPSTVAPCYRRTPCQRTECPGHYLIGRPLRAVPLPADSITAISNLRRWKLTQHLQANLWSQWSKKHLQELQHCFKWLKPQTNLCVGDLVMIKDAEFGRLTWPVGIIPGSDSLVRAADVRIEGKVYSCPVANLSICMPLLGTCLYLNYGAVYIWITFTLSCLTRSCQ